MDLTKRCAMCGHQLPDCRMGRSCNPDVSSGLYWFECEFMDSDKENPCKCTGEENAR